MSSPAVPAQLTLKAILLGIALAIILAGANAYLGLFAGMTVSASIPAAVISMGLLRLFKTSNILENNIVQTAASAAVARIVSRFVSPRSGTLPASTWSRSARSFTWSGDSSPLT